MDITCGEERVPVRGTRGPAVVHAVPVGDRTRSAVCGRSVRRRGVVWRDDDPVACPECRRLLRPARPA